ncbi:hypothetical protein B0A52_04075 [Exophiala mesophila]|uniref:Uncharacterized protein n=1 Tax=Exophiala mesophila TaxID=212818 RepID=A0A438NA71_EXOME|nr:hypothetical protein B0A52_04075 [Exophiala mesophila]
MVAIVVAACEITAMVVKSFGSVIKASHDLHDQNDSSGSSGSNNKSSTRRSSSLQRQVSMASGKKRNWVKKAWERVKEGTQKAYSAATQSFGQDDSQTDQTQQASQQNQEKISRLGGFSGSSDNRDRK